jgi:hypothetical protein
MDINLIKNIKLLYPSINEDRFYDIKCENENLYKDNIIENQLFEDIGFSINNIGDKKKISPEYLFPPIKYIEYKDVYDLIHNSNISNILKNKYLIEFNIQISNFNYSEKFTKPNLIVTCFPEECKICKHGIDIVNSLEDEEVKLYIICKNDPSHKFIYEDYCY